MPVRIAYSAGIRLYPAVCYGITLRVPLSEVIRGQTALHDVRRSPFGILIEVALKLCDLDGVVGAIAHFGPVVPHIGEGLAFRDFGIMNITGVWIVRYD